MTSHSCDWERHRFASTQLPADQAAVQAAVAQPRSELTHSSRSCRCTCIRWLPMSAVAQSAQLGERWWSLEWSVATALVTGDPHVNPDTPVSDEALRERIAREMVVVGDQPSPLAASVVVWPPAGSCSTTTVRWPSGYYANPASARAVDGQVVAYAARRRMGHGGMSGAAVCRGSWDRRTCR